MLSIGFTFLPKPQALLSPPGKITHIYAILSRAIRQRYHDYGERPFVPAFPALLQ